MSTEITTMGSKDDEIDDSAQDYEEDNYLEYARKSDTPSFDQEDVVDYLFPSQLLSPSASWSATNFVISEDDYDDGSCSIENEFVSHDDTQPRRNQIKDILRVKFQNLSKSYLARVTNNNRNYLKFLNLVKGL